MKFLIAFLAIAACVAISYVYTYVELLDQLDAEETAK